MESDLRRLHPLSWLFLTVSFAKGLIVPLLFVLFASGSNPWARYELFGAVFIVPVLVGALIKQRVFSYRFEADELTIRDGVLTRNERSIPYDRIHNVAVVRNPFHRLLGVASVRIETAGGGAPEAILRVLGLGAVDELRQQTLEPRTGARREVTVSDETTDAPWADRGESRLLEIPPLDLIKLGLATGPGIVLALAAGYLYQLQWWEFDWIDTSKWLQGQSPEWLEWLLQSGSLGSRFLLGCLVVLLVVVLLRSASAAWHLLKYWNFTLARKGDDLRTDYGMLTNVSLVIPVHRIQLVTVRASVLHRWFRRATVEFESAGSSDAGSDLDAQLGAAASPSRRQFLAPMLEPTEATSLLSRVVPDFSPESVVWQPLSARARRRLLGRTVKLVVPLTVLLVVALELTARFHWIPSVQALWLPLLVLPYSYFNTTGWLRHAGWGLSDRAVFYRSGWLKRSVSMVPFSRIQSVSQVASFFDRRRDMATISVDTAGAGTLGHRIQIPYLDSSVADEIHRRLFAAAAATEFDW